MTYRLSSVLLSAAVVLSGTALSAQHASLPAASAAPHTLPFPTDRALTDVAADGTLWAGGAMWKASFTADGVHFTPCLGSAAPSHPVHFRLAQVRVGQTPLTLAAAAPSLATQRVTYDHGSVRETYDLLADGVEQSFVLARLPSRDDVQITVAVDTDLQVEADHGGYRFACGDGGVAYGRATVVDAAGHRLELTTQWNGEALQIEVPKAFVVSAQLPLLVDPMIGVATPLTPQQVDIATTDIAFDQSLAQYYVTYERAFSATDHDVYVACLDASMQFQTLLTIDYTTQYWSKPRVATLEAHDVGCVIAETSMGNVSPFAVQVRRFHGGAAPTLEAVQSVASDPQLDRIDPDIGGDSSPTGPSRFLLVWESENISVNDTDVVFSMMTPAGTRADANLSTAIALHPRPHVSKTCGAPGGGTESWAIVYRNEDYLTRNGTLRLACVDRNGMQRWFPNGHSFMDLTATTPAAGSDWDVSSPTNDSEGRFYMCVERRIQASGNGYILGILFDRYGFEPVGLGNVVTGARDHFTPRVDCDGVRFAVTYSTAYTAPDLDIHVQSWLWDHLYFDYCDMTYATASSDRESAPVICAAPGMANEFGMAWVRTSGANQTVQCQRYLGIGSGGFTQRSTGCGSVPIVANGLPAIGETFQVTLPGAPGLCGFIAGNWANLPVGPCPGCIQGATGSTLFGPTLSITIPVSSSFVGWTLSVQGFQLAQSGLPCLGQAALSNTIDVTFQ